MSTEKDLVKITVMDKGPYKVEGTFILTYPDGVETKKEGITMLCRCGHSHKKPFCDGTHQKIHFEEKE